MRLQPAEVKAIKAEAAAIFGPSVVVRLFGSRVDDARRGGDIDLYLDVDADRCTLEREIKFQVRLEKILGERKIDVVLHPHRSPLQPIDRVAIEKGVVL